MAAGLFVAFEGGEGAGKSTQIRLLAERLRAAGADVVATREPGEGEIGAAIRAILLSRATVGLGARAEALLYAADRAQHVEALVRPALDRGQVVLCDRYLDSSIAYQGEGRALDPGEIERISRWAVRDLMPDLTVLLDVDPRPGLARAGGPARADRIEAEPLEFHERVRARFLALAAREPARYLVLDAGRPREAVHSDIWAAVSARAGVAG
jgi:dTMP kinase